MRLFWSCDGLEFYVGVCAFGGVVGVLAVRTVVLAVWSSQMTKSMQLGRWVDSKTVYWARIHIQICGELCW